MSFFDITYWDEFITRSKERKRLSVISLSILSGLLFYFSWPNNSVFFLIFISFVPLIYSVSLICRGSGNKKSVKVFGVFFLMNLVWQGLGVSWLFDVSPSMYFISFTANAFNCSLPFLLVPFIYKKYNINGVLVFIVCATAFMEYVSQIYMFSTPCANIGFALGKSPWLIQHYSLIGVEGAAIWIMIVNVLIYKFLFHNYTLPGIISLCFFVIFVPLTSLLYYLYTVIDSTDNSDILIQHTDFSQADYYRDRDQREMIDSVFNFSFSGLKNKKDLVIWPESLVHQLGWLHSIDNEPLVAHLREKLNAYPNTVVAMGGIGFSVPPKSEWDSKYTTYNSEEDYYYNVNNVALAVSASGRTVIRGKEIFIPFQERVPYLNSLPFLNLLIKPVGSSIRYSPYQSVYSETTDGKGNKYLSVLCYEILFSRFIGKKCAEKEFGAIIVHANENWLSNLTGAEQYLCFNSAIAIQSQKTILRSSNQGISAIIDRKGNVTHRIEGHKFDSIQATIEHNYDSSFYSHIQGTFHFLSGIICLFLSFKSIFYKLKL